jgi:hypothetical protein
MGFLQTLGQVGGGAAKTYFDNNLGQKWREQQIKAEISKAMGKKELDVGVDDPALWDSSLSPEQRSQLEAQTGGMGLSRVGNRAFANEYDAKTYADQYNSLSGQYGRAADVYNRFGETDKALGLQRDKQMLDNSEQAAKLALAADRRQEQMATQQGKSFEWQATEQKRKDDLQENLRFGAGLSPKDRAAYNLEAYQTHGAPGEAERYQATQLALQTATGDARAKELHQGMVNALLTKGPTGVVEWYNSIGDGMTAKMKQTKDGTVIERYAGNTLVDATKPFKNSTQAMLQLGAMMTPEGALQLAKLEDDQRRTEAALIAARRPTAGGGETAASFQREMFNNYVAEIKRANPNIPESQAKTMAYAKLRDDYTQRDAIPAKPMSIKEKEEARALISERVRAENPKAKAGVINGLIQDELAAVGLGSGAKDPFAALANDSGSKPSRPAASATPQPGLKRADPNAAYMEKFEKWKAAKERYEHFSKKGDAAGMAHWKPIMDAYK